MQGLQLQRKVEGVEVAVCGFFDGERFVDRVNFNFGHKKLFPGNIGPSTSKVGTSMFWAGLNGLFAETLGKLEGWLADEGYLGSIDLNCIVNETGISPWSSPHGSATRPSRSRRSPSGRRPVSSSMTSPTATTPTSRSGRATRSASASCCRRFRSTTRRPTTRTRGTRRSCFGRRIGTASTSRTQSAWPTRQRPATPAGGASRPRGSTAVACRRRERDAPRRDRDGRADAEGREQVYEHVDNIIIPNLY